jgi:hypothetical protein
MMEWKPIETAPRDGTPFLAYGSYLYDGDRAVTEYQEIIEARTLAADDDFPWTNGSEAMRYDMFSHWQPLPSPPTT